MALTIKEIAELLVQEYDEVSILEILQIGSAELVQRFEDKIELHYDKLVQELEDEKDES